MEYMPTLTPETTQMYRYMAYMECLGVFVDVKVGLANLAFLRVSHNSQPFKH